MFAVDDGVFQGNFNLADILFLIAAIVFGIATFLAFSKATVVSIAWLVL